MQTMTLAIIKPDAFGSGKVGRVLAALGGCGLPRTGLAGSAARTRRSRGVLRGTPGTPLLRGAGGVHDVGALHGARRSNMSGPCPTCARSSVPRTRRRPQPGTVRALHAESKERNAIHGSDSDENARLELGFFFRNRSTSSAAREPAPHLVTAGPGGSRPRSDSWASTPAPSSGTFRLEGPGESARRTAAPLRVRRHRVRGPARGGVGVRARGTLDARGGVECRRCLEPTQVAVRAKWAALYRPPARITPGEEGVWALDPGSGELDLAGPVREDCGSIRPPMWSARATARGSARHAACGSRSRPVAARRRNPTPVGRPSTGLGGRSGGGFGRRHSLTFGGRKAPVAVFLPNCRLHRSELTIWLFPRDGRRSSASASGVRITRRRTTRARRAPSAGIRNDRIASVRPAATTRIARSFRSKSFDAPSAAAALRRPGRGS